MDIWIQGLSSFTQQNIIVLTLIGSVCERRKNILSEFGADNVLTKTENTFIHQIMFLTLRKCYNMSPNRLIHHLPPPNS